MSVLVNENTKVTIEIPVSFINEEESPGIKRGGILNVTRYNVEVLCPVASIPEKFDFEVTTQDAESWAKKIAEELK